VISREQAIEHALEHVVEQLRTELTAPFVTEGWPGGVYAAKDEPVWAVRIPDATLHVGSSRYIVISKATGRVLADERAGE
jgi:hypothetical protein